MRSTDNPFYERTDHRGMRQPLANHLRAVIFFVIDIKYRILSITRLFR